jgi:septum formation protein
MKLKRFFYNRIIRPIITVHDNPEPMALGVFIGIFIGTTPTIGVQIPLAIIIAALLGANKIVAAAMTWPANYLTAVPLYWFEHYVGAKILGKATLHFDDIQSLLSQITFTNFWQVVGKDLFWPLMVGGAIVALIFAVPWYPFSLWFLRARRRRINKRMSRLLTGRRLIIASASSRRQRLVREWGYDFEVIESNVQPHADCAAHPLKTALYNARLKAKDVAGKVDDAVVVAADTVIAYKGKTYHKPADEADALRILRELNGTRHSVITAICAIDAKTGRTTADHDEVIVRTRKMTEDEILAFVKERGLSRSGPYKVQIDNDDFIKRNDGHLDTVIGFPRYIFERMMPRLLGERNLSSADQPARKVPA